MMSAMSSLRRELDSVDVQVLVDSIPALIHTSRPDGHLDYFNKRWLEYLGVPLDKVAGWNWTAFIHPEDVEGILTKWRACLATGEIFEYETRVRSANGDYRWMFHRKVPLRDAKGNIVKWYGSSMDIDERKTAEEQLLRNAEELQRSEFYLAEGQRLAHMGSWAFDPDGFYYWSPELFRMHGLDPASKPPSVQEYLDRVHPHDRESMAELIKGILAKASPFDATKRIVRPNGEVRYIRCVGVPVVETQSPKKYVGSAIDVTEHELLTQELRRREAYLMEAQTLSHTGSFGWKPDTGEIVWSDETYRIFEYDRSVRLTIDSLMLRVHPQDRADFQKVIDGAFRGTTDFEHTYRLLLPDERVKHVHAIAHALQDASGNREFVGAVTDITERKTTEDKVRRLVEAGILGIYFANVEGEIVEANQAFLQMLQYGRQDLVSGRLRWEDLTPVEWRERDERSLREFLATGVFQAYEKEYFRKDGSRVPVLIGGARFQSANEGVVFVLDLSEQKRAEEKIREQESELRQIVDLVPQINAVFGPGGERLYANRIGLEYAGLSLEEWRQTPGNFFSSPWLIHPDDRERAARTYSDNARSGDSAFELELRLPKRDGTYRWFLARFNPLRDEHGQITRWYVAYTDIEDRKRAEDRLQSENVALREEIDKASMFEEIVGTSPALKNVLSLISKVAPSDSTVLITGETGTGKELVARAIHRRSDRASRPFVSVNCAAIPRDLIASELFGHEKGAFTGATQQRLGRFELANGGTIFLDEVGELPVETQIALLRVLQEHEFERVGGCRRIRADVRVIAATNRDLQAAISTGSFRSDLFYRLDVFPIEMPSLRERRADIPLLVEYFIDRYARKAGKNIKRVNKKTLELLQSYPWPGNIRELQNVIERSVILCETEIFSIDENWLPQPPPLTPESNEQVELHRRLLMQEKNMIEAALKDTRGRVSGPRGAAVKLGIPRSTLESKIRSLKINRNRFRPIPET
jgi:formate hydrogenlyase transcriptional activator